MTFTTKVKQFLMPAIFTSLKLYIYIFTFIRMEIVDKDFKVGFVSGFQPLVWWRYIDDIFMIWEHGEEELQNFLETLNCYHPTIKFTAEYSRV